MALDLSNISHFSLPERVRSFFLKLKVGLHFGKYKNILLLMAFLQKVSFCKFTSKNTELFSACRRKKIFFAVASLIIIFILMACNHRELKIESVVPCEYSYSDGNCDNKLDSKKDYSISFTKDGRIDTYSQLSNFLYFKSRFSTGFIIKFNRPPVLPEKEIIKSTYKVYYNFSGTYGQVEGIDIGEDYIYSFVYLGTLLLEKQKEKREEGKAYPKNTILSFPIEFKYKSELFEGTVNTEQEIKIVKE